MDSIIPTIIEGQDDSDRGSDEERTPLKSDYNLRDSPKTERNSNKNVSSQPEIDESTSDNESELVTPTLLNKSISVAELPTLPKHTLPLFNTKEKIIFVLDRGEDDNYTPFRLSNNDAATPLSLLKRSIGMFINWKTFIDNKHDYALIVLNESTCSWVLGFTKKISEITNKLSDIKPCETEDIFSLNQLFELIAEKVTVPHLGDPSIPPPYVVRIILLYSRSYTIPEFKCTKEIEQLLSSPYVTLDILMTHEPIIGIKNSCNKKIFNILKNIDMKGMSYFFPVSRNIKCLYSSVGMLLSHPMQRPFKQYADYSINNVDKL